MPFLLFLVLGFLLFWGPQKHTIVRTVRLSTVPTSPRLTSGVRFRQAEEKPRVKILNLSHHF